MTQVFQLHDERHYGNREHTACNRSEPLCSSPRSKTSNRGRAYRGQIGIPAFSIVGTQKIFSNLFSFPESSIAHIAKHIRRSSLKIKPLHILRYDTSNRKQNNSLMTNEMCKKENNRKKKCNRYGMCVTHNDTEDSHNPP